MNASKKIDAIITKNKIKIKSYGKLMKNEVNSLFGINGKGSKSNILRKFLGVVSEK